MRVLDAMRSQSDRSAVAKVGGSELIAPLYYLDSFTWGIGLPAALLAVAGLVLAVRAMPRRLLILALPALVVLVALSLFDRAFARWALPAYPVLASLAGYAVVWGAGRTRRPALVAAVAGVLVCLPGLVASVHLDRLLSKTDTRLEARRVLLAETAPGSRIVIEPTLPSRLTTGVRGAKTFRVLARGFDVEPQPADVDTYRRLGACYVVSQNTYRERMEARNRAQSDAYYARLPRRVGPRAHVLAVARAERTCRCTSTGRSTTTPRVYVRPGTEVTIYHLKDCTPSTAAFPPGFANPYRDRLGSAADLASGPCRRDYATR